MCWQIGPRITVCNHCQKIPGSRRKIFRHVIQTMLVRTTYSIHAILIAWRVVKHGGQDYWPLMGCISFIGIETLYTVIKGNTTAPKWLNPSVFFYLVSTVPLLCLLLTKLLHDRSVLGTDCGNDDYGPIYCERNLTLGDWGDHCVSNQTQTCKCHNVEKLYEWTLGLQQLLIYVLVFGRWIAPKGRLTKNELSQLLLIHLGAAADIMEILDSFNENKIACDEHLIYVILTVWSWSLLQFCLIPTVYMEIPSIPDKTNGTENIRARRSNGDKENKVNETVKEIGTTGKKFDVTSFKSAATNNESSSSGMGLESNLSQKIKSRSSNSQFSGNITLQNVHLAITEGLDNEIINMHCLLGRCFRPWFCFYNEIWGIVLGLLFQDIPFAGTRLYIMAFHNTYSYSTLVFTFKNIVTIILSINRIRVVVLDEYKPWKERMNEVDKFTSESV